VTVRALQISIVVAIFNSPVGVRTANYCYQRVCMSVSLSVRSHVSKITTSTFHVLSIHVTCGRGSILPMTAVQHVVMSSPVLSITSCFRIMERMGQNQTTLWVVQFARWQHLGRSMPSATASCHYKRTTESPFCRVGRSACYYFCLTPVAFLLFAVMV